METVIKKTGDGSFTLYVPELDEHYHSTFGAFTESRHVFIDAGLKKKLPVTNTLQILEIGFGTGLNALLTFFETEGHLVNYTSIEPFPVNDDIISQLEYWKLLQGKEVESMYRNLHKADWNKQCFITDKFTLLKIRKKIQDTDLPGNYFDLVYFDAFGPEVQPELWTFTIFRKIYDSMRPGGLLTTYSAKGTVKRNLRSAGFLVERLPGPPGKRHMTRATKIGDNI